MNKLNFLNFKKDFLSPENISKYCFEFWDKYFKIFFLLFSFSVLFLGVCFWFQIMYQSDWNSDQKKQYQNSQSKEVELKEQQFEKVAKEFERKKEIYNISIQPAKDIFASYEGNQTGEENSQSGSPSSNNNAPVSNL